MLQPSTHQTHTAFVCVYMKKTMASSCFLGLKGHSDPSCPQSFGTMTILWIPQIFYRLALKVSSNRSFNDEIYIYTLGFMYVYVSFCICMYSISVCLWPCLSECQRLLIGRLMDWADPVAGCMQPFVAARTAHSSNTACLWGYRPNTGDCSVFYTPKKTY